MTTRQDFDMDILVSWILRVGLFSSLFFLVIGLGWRWRATGSFYMDYELPKSDVLEFMRQEIRLTLAGGFRPRLFINLGILVLMLTPYLRVLASMVYFAFVEKNGKYALFTAFVLSVLTYSLILR